MIKKLPLIIIGIIVLVLSGTFYYQKVSKNTVATNRNYPSIQNFDFYSINDIKQKNLASGTYDTEGYVVKLYECPFCPQGAQCKPCMRDNIVISENNKLLEAYSLSDKEMILFANNPKQFDLGKKYTFSIKILDYKSTSEPINDVEIVGYNSNNNSVDCYDCGEGGWQKMSEKCGQAIITRNDLKSCLINFSWSSVNQNTSTDEIKNGYIEIGGSEVLKNPTTKSIKVFIYHQWAVDKDGNLYLLGQLG